VNGVVPTMNSTDEYITNKQTLLTALILSIELLLSDTSGLLLVKFVFMFGFEFEEFGFEIKATIRKKFKIKFF